jgi:hypothetical protein
MSKLLSKRCAASQGQQCAPAAQRIFSKRNFSYRHQQVAHLLVELCLRQRRQPGAEGLQEGLDGGVQVRCRMRGGLDDEDLRAAAMSDQQPCFERQKHAAVPQQQQSEKVTPGGLDCIPQPIAAAVLSRQQLLLACMLEKKGPKHRCSNHTLL